MAFQPGQSGNPGGIRNVKIWKAALERVIKQGDGEALRQAAEALVRQAAEGDIAAIRELGDRLDGKPNQQMLVEGGDTPILTKAIVELIHASGSDTKTSTS